MRHSYPEVKKAEVKVVLKKIYRTVERWKICSEISHIDCFQSRDHFTIGRHIGAHVNSELVSREL